MNQPEHTAKVVMLIAARRASHASKYDSEHDDQHVNYELTWAASAFLMASGWPVSAQGEWPFSEPFKPRKTYRENLIEAAALIVAEIERLDRRGNLKL